MEKEKLAHCQYVELCHTECPDKMDDLCGEWPEISLELRTSLRKDRLACFKEMI